MKVLVACEFSGIIREAFRRNGHVAWSCDLEASEIPGDHYQGDIREILGYPWDLLIAHPPCTRLAASGARWFQEGGQAEAIAFFMLLANCPVPHIAIENPVGIMSRIWRKPDQIIQPWQYGDDASKSTCLWLKNLPLLKPTDILIRQRYSNQTRNGDNKMGRIKNRVKARNRTYPGIAKAMADQWG